MSITGLPGQGPVRVGIPDCRSLQRQLRGHGRVHRADRAGDVGRGPVGADLAAAGADLHARLPGRALDRGARRCRARPATTTRPRSRPACSRRPTATSTSPRQASTSSSACARRWMRRSLLSDPDFATGEKRSENRVRLNAEIGRAPSATRSAGAGREAQRGRRAVGADLRHRPDVRRSAGASMSAWRCRCRIRRARCGDRQPGRGAVAHAIGHRPPDAQARRAHRRGAGGTRLRQRRRSATCAGAR